MGKVRINLDLVYDDGGTGDPLPEHVVMSIQRHLRRTGHRGLLNTKVELIKVKAR